MHQLWLSFSLMAEWGYSGLLITWGVWGEKTSAMSSGSMCCWLHVWKIVFHYICLTRGRDNCVQWLEWSAAQQSKLGACEVKGTCHSRVIFWDEALNTSLSQFEAHRMWFQVKKIYSHPIFVRWICEQSHSLLILFGMWLINLCRCHLMKGNCIRQWTTVNKDAALADLPAGCSLAPDNYASLCGKERVNSQNHI